MAVTDQTDTMYAGNKRTLRFTIVDEDTPGSPAFNLTGKTAKFTFARISPDGNVLTTPVLEKKSSDPAQIAITSAALGKLEVYLVEADTIGLLGDFYFELELFETATPTDRVVVGTGTETILTNVINT